MGLATLGVPAATRGLRSKPLSSCGSVLFPLLLLNLRPIEYLVTQPNGHRVCTCPDFDRHEEEEGFACKHIMAVELAQDMGFLPGKAPAPPAPSSPAELAVLHRHLAGEDPVRLKLIKNTKGYSWEISVAEKDPQAALAAIQDLEQRVRAAFGTAEE